MLSIFKGILAVSLWLIKRVVVKEETYIEYITRGLLHRLNDKCSDEVLASLDVYGAEETEYHRHMNRSSLRTEILKVQQRRISQWELGNIDDRSITDMLEFYANKTTTWQRVN